MSETNLENSTEAFVRPRMLKVLCVLTFVWSGGITLFSAVGLVLTDRLIRILTQLFPKLEEVSINLHLLMMMGCLMLLIFSAASVWGGILMLRMRKTGFVIYTIANGLVILLQIFLKISPTNVGFALISLAFILMYARYYKTMK
ncbi:MAG: hypothetical protein WCM76_13445 [Bacteroidota bacterium]